MDLPTEPNAAAQRVLQQLANNGAPGASAVDEVFSMIDRLDTDPHPDAVQEIIAASANLRQVDISAVKRRLKKAAGVGAGDFDRALRTLKRGGVQANATRQKDADGLVIHEYVDDFDAVEVGKALRAVMLELNDVEGERLPIITYGAAGAMKLSEKPDGSPCFGPLSHDQFHARANMLLALSKLDENGNRGPRKHVPVEVSKTLYNTAHHHLPATPELLRVPVFAATGELLRVDGWREDHGILLETGGLMVGDVPAEPTPEDVADALRILRDELLTDFPFFDYDSKGEERREPAEAHALAMLITPFARRLFPGCSPLFWISKPMPGTGGTLLGEIPARVLEGGEPVQTVYARGNDEENRKELIAACVESRNVLWFDDQPVFDSRVHIRAITAATIGGRLLGRNETVQRPNNFLWIGSGNNTWFGEEMGRRVLPIRLNAKRPDLHNRTYKHPELPTWIADNRAEIIRAILVLIQNWIAQERPEFTDRTKVSFQGWACVVGGILQAAGVEGFLDLRQVAEVDPHQAQNRQFVMEWRKRFSEPTAAKALANHAISMALDIVEGRTDEDQRKRLYERLRELADRTFNLGSEDKPVLMTVLQTFDDTGAPVYQLTEIDNAKHAGKPAGPT